GRRGRREFGDVGAGDEDRRLSRRKNDALDVAGALHLVDDGSELHHHCRRELVHLVAGQVEPDDCQIPVALDAKGRVGCGFNGGGHARFTSRTSSADSSAYISSMISLYFLSMFFRFTLRDGVISSA